MERKSSVWISMNFEWCCDGGVIGGFKVDFQGELTVEDSVVNVQFDAFRSHKIRCQKITIPGGVGGGDRDGKKVYVVEEENHAVLLLGGSGLPMVDIRCAVIQSVLRQAAAVWHSDARGAIM